MLYNFWTDAQNSIQKYSDNLEYPIDALTKFQTNLGFKIPIGSSHVKWPELGFLGDFWRLF